MIPALPWLASLLTLVFALRLRGFRRIFGVVFALEIAADAALTGPWSPIPPGTAAATAAGVVFVIAGDLRYFVAYEHVAGGKARLLRAVGLAFVVPVVSHVLALASPRAFANERVVYLVYELLFVLLAAIMLARAGRLPEASRKVAREITAFELAQYGLWAGADAILLKTGSDAGYAPRIAANVMYYALFVAFVLWRAPREEGA